MTDVVIPLITAFGGIFIGIASNWAWRVFERGQRRRTLVAALVSEAANHGVSLWRLLHEYPKSVTLAVANNQFYRAVATYETAGDVFYAHISSSDVIGVAAIRGMSDAYAALRAAAHEAEHLTTVGARAGHITKGMMWAFKDRLAWIVADLREAVSLLESVGD